MIDEWPSFLKIVSWEWAQVFVKLIFKKKIKHELIYEY